jgi:hypothetical protein
MLRIVAAAIAMTLLSGAAHAQGMKLTNPRQHHSDPQQAADEDTKRTKEKDYKSALDRIPAQAGTVDPWQNVREKPSQSKTGR